MILIYLGVHCNGGNDCCTESNQCDAGEGDCDKDEDCVGSLTCGTNNCPKGSTFSRNDDCCEWVSGLPKVSNSPQQQ